MFEQFENITISEYLDEHFSSFKEADPEQFEKMKQAEIELCGDASLVEHLYGKLQQIDSLIRFIRPEFIELAINSCDLQAEKLKKEQSFLSGLLPK